ncbi:MAG: ATP-dependent DNA helicase RecG [Candidatus Omnitrophica bacterium]|nr:ATP-dependent DNA helicase RecG [Candidatus Omnitrophota bacterium]
MQEKKELSTSKIQYLKGVGPSRAEQLSRLGIYTVYDLLYYLPRRYEDRSEIVPVKDVRPENVYTIKGRIKRHGIWKSKKGMLIYEMVVSDGTGNIHAVWYNQPYLRKYFKMGEDIILYGKVEKFKSLQITHPDYEILKEEEGSIDTVNMGRIVPIYPLTQDVTQKYLRSLVNRAIEGTANLIKEVIPTQVRARCRLADAKFAVTNIHFPVSFESLKMAERRIIFEEFFIFETALALIKKDREKRSPGVRHEVKESLFEDFTDMLPFELTKEQVEAIKSIESDMKSSVPMNRLLEGEVGSGKTVVAMYALLLTIKNSFQGVVMVPTEILAQQHYLTLSEFFAPAGINVKLLTGSMSDEEKDKVKKELKEGSAGIIVGTHSLIQEDISFDKVGLLVIDEQHKFGVSQRALLRKKDVKADVLIMTATPIPRTLALTVYGDLDISEIRELPEGRQAISTYWVEEERKDKVYKFAKEEILNGRQAYIVCPRIEETGKSDLASAKNVYEHLAKNVFPEFKLALIHGRMKAAEKDKIMKDFKKNKINILVSTTVIEVGIDIPNAAVMIIENADRFGLAQLHQLRGRIGRGGHKSYCILISNPESDEAKRRLEAFEQLQSGFELAEEDFSIRGPGQILGTRQHGLPEIKFGDIIEDKAILELARKEAFELVEHDSGLKDERNRNLREAVSARYKGKTEFLRVG